MANAKNLALIKKREEALRASEVKSRTIFNAVNDAIFVVRMNEDGTLGTFIEVNDLACQKLGYSREEFLNMSPFDIVTPEEMERIRQEGIYGQILQGDSVTFEIHHVARDGSQTPVEINLRAANLNNEQVRLVIARDITRRKQAEKSVNS